MVNKQSTERIQMDSKHNSLDGVQVSTSLLPMSAHSTTLVIFESV